MASATKLKSGSWRVLARKVVNGKMINKSFTVSPKDFISYGKEASKKAKQQAELLAREWLLKKEEECSGIITVEKAIDDYIEDRSSVISPSTIADYYRMKKYFKDILDVNIFDVTTKMLQSIIHKMSKQVNRYGNPLNDRTIKNRIFFLLAVFKYNEHNKHYDLRFPAHSDPTLEPPSKNEFIRLLECAENNEQKLILMLAGLYTLRRGEICGLIGSDILWDMNSIYIQHSRVLDNKKNWICKPPKTEKSTRFIQIDKQFMELFPKVGPNEYVISLNPNQVTKMFMRLRKKAGVTCRLHDLRKYAASIRSDIMPRKYVECDGGWKKDSIVLYKIYDRPFQEDRVAYSKKFNKMAQEDYGESLLG